MSEEKTEQATPRKLIKARDKGSVPRSQYIGGYIALLAFMALGHGIFNEMQEATSEVFKLLVFSLRKCGTPIFEQCLGVTLHTVYEDTLNFAYRLGGLFIVGSLAGSLSIGGLTQALTKLAPNLKTLSPVSYSSRTFGRIGRQKALVLMLVATGFICFCAFELTLMIYSPGDRISLDLEKPLVLAMLSYLGQTSLPYFVLWMGLVVILDSDRQVKIFKKDQMMTKHELKDERKDTQQMPNIKRNRENISRIDSRYSLSDGNFIISSASKCIILYYDVVRAPVPVVLFKCTPARLRTLPLDMKKLSGAMFYDVGLVSRMDSSIPIGNPITREFYVETANYLRKQV